MEEERENAYFLLVIKLVNISNILLLPTPLLPVINTFLPYNIDDNTTNKSFPNTN